VVDVVGVEESGGLEERAVAWVTGSSSCGGEALVRCDIVDPTRGLWSLGRREMR
jgi:hypothetical protein